MVCIRNTVLAGHPYGKEKERPLKFYTTKKKYFWKNRNKQEMTERAVFLLFCFKGLGEGR